MPSTHRLPTLLPTLALTMALTLFTLASSPAAAQVKIEGQTFAAQARLGDTDLKLNGVGLRAVAWLKGYAAGLYLTKKAGTAEEVMVATGPKRLSITMLREIDSAELGKLFTRGVEDNSPRSEMSKLIPGLMRMSQIFSDQKKLLPGENFLIEWVPGTGTVITVKGKVQGEPFKEPEFFNALMRIWLGPNPADWKLKDALLGK